MNSKNIDTSYKLTLNSRFSTNDAGGLNKPEPDILGDLAVASATGDYFYIESNEESSSFTFSELDKNKGYKFYAFGSRSATQIRTAVYNISGKNTEEGELQAAGKDYGGAGVHQNVQDIYTSEIVFPNENSEIKFTISRKTGDYIPLNTLKIEEYINVK